MLPVSQRNVAMAFCLRSENTAWAGCGLSRQHRAPRPISCHGNLSVAAFGGEVWALHHCGKEEKGAGLGCELGNILQRTLDGKGEYLLRFSLSSGGKTPNPADPGPCGTASLHPAVSPIHAESPLIGTGA